MILGSLFIATVFVNNRFSETDNTTLFLGVLIISFLYGSVCFTYGQKNSDPD